MKISFKISALVIGIALLSCSKSRDSEDIYTQSYEFHVEAEMDGQSRSWIAGLDGYYMSTDYSHSDSILDLKGELMHTDGQRKNSIAFVYRYPEAIINTSNFDLSKLFGTDELVLRNALSRNLIDGEFEVQLYVDSSIYNVPTINWNVSNQTSVVQGYNCSIPLKEGEMVDVRMDLNSASSCSIDVIHQISTKQETNASFNLLWIQADLCQMQLKERNSDVKRIEWYVNNTLYSTVLEPIVSYGNYPMGDIHIVAKIFYMNGEVRNATKILKRTNIYHLDCSPDFNWRVKQKSVPNPSNFGTLEIIYYDEDGVAFSTKNSRKFGSIDVIAQWEYQENQLSQKTRKIRFAGSAILQNRCGEEIVLDKISGNIALAHP